MKSIKYIVAFLILLSSGLCFGPIHEPSKIEILNAENTRLSRSFGVCPFGHIGECGGCHK